jgi:hypothetical protein
VATPAEILVGTLAVQAAGTLVDQAAETPAVLVVETPAGLVGEILAVRVAGARAGRPPNQHAEARRHGFVTRSVFRSGVQLCWWYGVWSVDTRDEARVGTSLRVAVVHDAPASNASRSSLQQ